MIESVNRTELIKSWIDFAKQYEINSECTKYPIQIDMLANLQNGYCYPQLIFPENIISRVNNPFTCGMKLRHDKNGIYLQDIIDKAGQLDPSLNDIEYLIPPVYPYLPRIEKIPETKTIYVTSYHIGYWIIVSIILLIIWVLTAIGTGEIGVGLLYSLCFSPTFLIAAYQFDLMKSTRVTKTVKLSEKELNEKREKAKISYEERLKSYNIQKATFQDRFDTYLSQQRSNMKRIEPIFDDILWKIFGKFRTSDETNIERAVEVPQRGRSENMLFERLMENFPYYVKIDMQVGRYFPDICIIIPNTIAIDIEIDEPYVYNTKEETHYRGCGDDLRNEMFVSNGWYVLRFSEEQIITNTEKCVQIVQYLIGYVRTGNFFKLKKLNEQIQLMACPRWTKEQARLMAIKNSRDNY